jgi:hypothetical protein
LKSSSVSATELVSTPGRGVFNAWRPGREPNFATQRTVLRLNLKSYSKVGPLAERLLRTFSEAVFILTRNCSSNLRPLISLNERSLLQFIERRVPDEWVALISIHFIFRIRLRKRNGLAAAGEERARLPILNQIDSIWEEAERGFGADDLSAIYLALSNGAKQ